jgi:flagellar basal-body rod protein FlgG
MIRALYSSATGMKAQETLLDVTANNLANVNTNGFKRSHVDFADLLYSAVRQPGGEVSEGQNAPVGLEIGSGARAVATTKLFTSGSLDRTGNSTDVAIEGSGFFKLTLADGSFRYTRDGAFHPDATGQLVSGDGLPLDGGITIEAGINLDSVTIGVDGTVSAVRDGQNTNLGRIQLFRFPNPAGLSSVGGNLYAANEASGAEVPGTPGTDGLGTLRQGFIESSNVEVVTELVGLITAQRAYEVNARAIRAGDEMLSQTAQIVR